MSHRFSTLEQVAGIPGDSLRGSTPLVTHQLTEARLQAINDMRLALGNALDEIESRFQSHMTREVTDPPLQRGNGNG